jgi:CheY-like chemotaxis protein
LVAAVGDARSLLAAVADHHPDVVVTDIRMPPTHTDEGLRAAVELRRHHREVGVLVLSQYIETTYATALLAGNAGGVGYLLKDRVADAAEFPAPSRSPRGTRSTLGGHGVRANGGGGLGGLTRGSVVLGSWPRALQRSDR